MCSQMVWGFPLHALRIQADRLHLVQYLIQHLALLARLVEHSVLEVFSVLPSPIVETGTACSPVLFALIVDVGCDTPAVFDPADLARYKLGFFVDEIGY